MKWTVGKWVVMMFIRSTCQNFRAVTHSHISLPLGKCFIKLTSISILLTSHVGTLRNGIVHSRKALSSIFHKHEHYFFPHRKRLGVELLWLSLFFVKPGIRGFKPVQVRKNCEGRFRYLKRLEFYETDLSLVGNKRLWLDSPGSNPSKDKNFNLVSTSRATLESARYYKLLYLDISV